MVGLPAGDGARERSCLLAGHGQTFQKSFSSGMGTTEMLLSDGETGSAGSSCLLGGVENRAEVSGVFVAALWVISLTRIVRVCCRKSLVQRESPNMYYM